MSLNIALIDDDPSVGRSLGRLLRHAGMNSTTFESAHAFLVSPLRSTFDCLVLDIYLEGDLSGLELKQRLNEEGTRTPVIFFSAHDDAETQDEAARVGCHAIHRKGDDINLLLDSLKALEHDKS